MNKWFYTFFFLSGLNLFFAINSFSQVKKGLYNYEDFGFLIDSGKVNNLNNDNAIYKSRNTFLFDVKIKSNGKKVYCTVFIDPSKGIPNWRLSQKRAPEDSSLAFIDKIKLYVYETKSNNSLAETQTLIKYDYYSKHGKIFLGETTGVVDNDSSMFIHPPRSYYFVVNEFNPFVNLKLPLEIGKSWTGIISLVPSHFDYYPDFFKEGEIFQTDVEYKVLSKKRLKTSLGKLECYKINAKQLVGENETKTTIFYNEKYGMVKSITENFDNNKIILSLIENRSEGK